MRYTLQRDRLLARMDKSSGFYMVKQLGVLVAGLGIIFIVHRINYTKFAKFSVILFMICIPLLILHAYSLRYKNRDEGSRWIKLPLINLTFSDLTDLARLAIFMFLARQLSVKQKVIKDFKKRIPAGTDPRVDHLRINSAC